MDVETTDLPETIEDAVEMLCERLYDAGTDESVYDGSVCDLLAEWYEVDPAEIRRQYAGDRLLDWTITQQIDIEMTHRGAGPGSYYGPEPDEYESHGFVVVLTDDGKVRLSRTFGEDGPPLLTKYLLKHG